MFFVRRNTESNKGSREDILKIHWRWLAKTADFLSCHFQRSVACSYTLQTGRQEPAIVLPSESIPLPSLLAGLDFYALLLRNCRRTILWRRMKGCLQWLCMKNRRTTCQQGTLPLQPKFRCHPADLFCVKKLANSDANYVSSTPRGSNKTGSLKPEISKETTRWPPKTWKG